MSPREIRPSKTLSFEGYELDLSKKTHIMGVLNVTPDSFSDGGLFLKKERAVARALEIEKEGASIIDVGGESTRPGADRVPAAEELKRVIPVIEAIRSKVRIPISIDTSKPVVAREALRSGASIINNIMGVILDGKMADLAAEFDCPLILMHIKGVPGTMQENPVYNNLMLEIREALSASIRIAVECGVDPQKIVIDPGIGFGKTARHNLEILRNLDYLKSLGKPIMVGPSRKAFIGTALGIEDPKGRIFGTAAAVAIAIANGADIVRVHDIEVMRQVSDLVDKIYE